MSKMKSFIEDRLSMHLMLIAIILLLFLLLMIFFFIDIKTTMSENNIKSAHMLIEKTLEDGQNIHISAIEKLLNKKFQKESQWLVVRPDLFSTTLLAVKTNGKDEIIYCNYINEMK